MRGSPILRTLVVLAALLVTGLALARLAAERPRETKQLTTAPETPAATKKASYELILSGTAKEVELNGGAATVTSSSTVGSLEVSGEQPVISLTVKWADQAPGHRFAKLRLEIPGRPTLEHVFDAAGDIDDIWEP
jgi:hypothetical protein